MGGDGFVVCGRNCDRSYSEVKAVLPKGVKYSKIYGCMTWPKYKIFCHGREPIEATKEQIEYLLRRWGHCVPNSYQEGE